MLVNMVPVEEYLASGDGLDPLNDEVHYSMKIPKELERMERTYFLPNGKCRGLMSTDLN